MDASLLGSVRRSFRKLRVIVDDKNLRARRAMLSHCPHLHAGPGRYRRAGEVIGRGSAWEDTASRGSQQVQPPSEPPVHEQHERREEAEY
jgi:hypothetical protein